MFLLMQKYSTTLLPVLSMIKYEINTILMYTKVWAFVLWGVEW
jgi:hypothetical protein